LAKALKRGAAQVAWEHGDIWTGYYTWENIPGWQWRVRTSKSKYRHIAEFDLTKRSMLFPLLERVPFAHRTGAVVKGEGGLPVRERTYRKRFRRIAVVAGIPNEVWNYDARAGGATEADNSGADLDLISAGPGHSQKETTLRYIRRRGAKLDALAVVRNASRGGGKEG
jgi:integrase